LDSEALRIIQQRASITFHAQGISLHSWVLVVRLDR
jgi:hypothetical protein